MIELGHYALCTTFILSLFQLITGLKSGQYTLSQTTSGHVVFYNPLPRLAAFLQVICLCVAWMCLTSAYIHSDFSVAVVAGNSHTDKPLLYKITGVWGNHEGSMLLWLFVLTLFGGAFAWKGRQFIAGDIYQKALGFQGAIGALFAAFILFTSNPFDRLFPIPLNGNDLNPLLQDIGLALHPPVLYLGYVGFSIIFSLTIAALVTKKLDSAWARGVKPWAVASWTFLTAGIGLGSWWAYYELGWGGFWFWDPVENASLMPWIAGTALIHTLGLLEKRNILKHWVILTSLLSFSCSILGTFLVRSGIITSVHAFAASPDRGLFILAIFTILVGGGLGLYAFYARDLESTDLGAEETPPLSLFSKEGILVLSNLLLTVCLFTILTGTLAPVITEALTTNKISVGPPYYNTLLFPLVVVMAVLMPFAMNLAWGKGRKDQIQTPLLISVTILSVIMGGVMLAVGLWIIALTLLHCGSWFYKRSVVPSLSVIAMWIAHAGVGLVLVGITGTTLLVEEKVLSIKQGDSFELGNYTLKLHELQFFSYKNYLSEQGIISVKEGEKPLEIIKPERRRYKTSGQVTTEAAITLHKGGDLYVALGETQKDGSRTIRAWIHPFVGFLWVGIIFTVLGGILSLIGAFFRQRN
jgi:cytochrome c-type biogenesis protein CcmF